jgi:hypothetical protein
MPAATKIYTRLTRNAAGVASYSSLWVASDHLLIVSSTGYNETYARIMFSDIKAFIITPTGRRLWWGLPWALIAAISGLRMLMLLGYGEAPTGSGIFFAVSAVALTLNWVWGQGCRVHVMTGVQNTVLPSLIRIKKTRAVLAGLQSRIVAAQATGTEVGATPAPPPNPPQVPAAGQPVGPAAAEPPETPTPPS